MNSINETDKESSCDIADLTIGEPQSKSIEKEVVALLPAVLFTGKIVVIDKDEQVDAAVEELMNAPVLGFDTETRPSFQKGVTHRVALLQLSTADTCFLFRLNRLGHIAPIARLLGNKEIKKVGIAIRDDIKGLAKRQLTEAQNFVELQTFSSDLGFEENGLQKLFARLFGQKISKRQRLSNWEAETLEPEKQRYAATDAWASLLIYLKLQEIKTTK